MKVREERGRGRGGVCGGVQVQCSLSTAEYMFMLVRLYVCMGVGGSCARVVGNSVYMC